MSTETNKRLVRRIPEELYNHWNLDLADELFALDYIEHTPLPPGFPTGRQAIKTYVTLLRAAFPDFRYTVEDLIAEGERVVVRVTAEGTQSGEFMGLPATGKRARWTETHICKIVDGKLVEH